MLTPITKKFSEKSENILTDKIIEKEVVRENVLKSNKFKCDKFDCSFKREIILRKHKNTRHAEQKSSKNKELGKGQFGFLVKGRKKKLSDIVKDSVEQNEEKLQNEKEIRSVQQEKNNEKEETGKEKHCVDASEDDNKKYNEEDISSNEDSEDDEAFLACFDDHGNNSFFI